MFWFGVAMVFAALFGFSGSHGLYVHSKTVNRDVTSTVYTIDILAIAVFFSGCLAIIVSHWRPPARAVFSWTSDVQSLVACLSHLVATSLFMVGLVLNHATFATNDCSQIVRIAVAAFGTSLVTMICSWQFQGIVGRITYVIMAAVLMIDLVHAAWRLVHMYSS